VPSDRHHRGLGIVYCDPDHNTADWPKALILHKIAFEIGTA
jgi:hypothetical protein